MKILKYFAGSLIISSGIVLLVAIMMRAADAKAPAILTDNLLLTWIALAIVIMPFAKNIIRVE